MKARKLNEQGVEIFSEYISKLREGAKHDPPNAILKDDTYTDTLEIDLDIENREFSTRFEMGEYLCDIFDGVAHQQIINEPGFWSWLALYWFDQLCPQKHDGSRNPSRSYNYILSKDYRHRPRHAILTTWMLVDKYGDSSLFMLSKSPSTRGEIIEQVAARQYYISCSGVIEAASKLYYDPDKKLLNEAVLQEGSLVQ